MNSPIYRTSLVNIINQDDIILRLVNYFRYLSLTHKEIKEFKTGSEYQDNLLNATQTPIFIFYFPILFNLVNNNSVVSDKLSVNFDISILSKEIVIDNNGNSLVVNYSNLPVPNQNNYDGLIVVDELESRTSRIAIQIVTKLINDIKSFKGLPSVDWSDVNSPSIIKNNSLHIIQDSISISLQTARNENVDDMAETKINISFNIENPYLCNINEFFFKSDEISNI